MSQPGCPPFSTKAVTSFLLDMERMHIAPYILTTLEYKLSLVLCVPYDAKYHLREGISNDLKNIVLFAIRHQNVIGWDNFLKGYVSKYWREIQMECTMVSMCQNWDVRMVQNALTLYQYMD
jgi:hypothetical protein